MARILPPRISLDDFVYEMAQIPSKQLELCALKELVGRLDLRDELIQEHIRFTQEKYARNLVCRTPRFDLLVLCWKPGHVTTIHDHAGSLSVVRVFDGELTNRTFERVDTPTPSHCLVRVAEEQRMGTTGFNCVDHGEIHQLANTSDRDLVTVHVYARPLKDLRVYCPQTGKIERVAMRFTLEDDFE